ncbi:uncharacterized protein LOC129883080 isoform X2 [Solanum dulcamara]|uniref:uncharacterized protein LOC129883080 isoform X2 n=1 Tax=Solanum dulcamara TaxID=45834 RepID=UPI0024868A8F|nr:uncharacterized protein LOC129883080 isoform X2 [Solanum dulcamara]
MESTEDETLPKQSKPTEIPSISSKDSVLSMPNLPAELITEFLLKLPVKSLLQFRSDQAYNNNRGSNNSDEDNRVTNNLCLDYEGVWSKRIFNKDVYNRVCK